jgi:hypothetical protein
MSNEIDHVCSDLSDKDRTYWQSKSYISPAISEEIAAADIVFVPFEGFRDHDGPVFPQGTSDLYRYLEENSKGKIHQEICIDDDKYVEVALHGATAIIATFIVKEVLFPVVLGLLSSYIYERFLSRTPDETVRVRIILDGDGKPREINYEGPASGLERGLKCTISKK